MKVVQVQKTPKQLRSPTPTPKSKNDPKIKLNSDVRIEGIIVDESCSTTWVDPKTVFVHNPDSENSQFGPIKVFY